MKRKYTRKESVNLPSDILERIEKACRYRKSLGLPDDREERVKRALRYQEFRNG